MEKIKVDIVWEDWGSLEAFIADCGKKFPRVFLRVVALRDDMSGWPEVEFMGTRGDLESLLEDLGFSDVIGDYPAYAE
jgi:hypothetical protein